MDDVVLNKVAAIERCVRRVREEHGGDDRHLTENITRQDSIVLNLQRACEAAIDLWVVFADRKARRLDSSAVKSSTGVKNSRALRVTPCLL